MPDAPLTFTAHFTGGDSGGTGTGTTPGTNLPKVGDTTPLVPLAVLTTLSAAGLGIALYRRRRQGREK